MLLNRSFIFLISLLSSFASLAQNSHTVNYKVWVVNDSNGNGPTVAEAQTAFAESQVKFDDVNITLNACFELLIDDQLYNNVSLAKTENLCFPFDPSKLNFYLTDACANATHPGCGNLPGSYPVGYSCDVSCYPISHEIGHMLGLFHTDDSFSCSDQIFDGQATDGEGCSVYSDSDEGDGIADTPVHPTFTGNCGNLPQTQICQEIDAGSPLGSQLAPLDCDGDGYTNAQECSQHGGIHVLDPWSPLFFQTCELDWSQILKCDGTAYGSQHDPDDILLFNIMGQVWPLSWPSCFTHCDKYFTCGQGVRMRESLDNELLEYSDPNAGCDPTPLSVGLVMGDVTLSATGLIREDIIIPNGSSLTITSPLILLEPGVRVIVQSGGTLALVNTRLSGSNCGANAADFWQGVEVQPGGIFTADDSVIELAATGLFLESTLASTNLLEIRDCAESARIVSVGTVSDNPDQGNELHLNNCIFRNPVFTESSTVFFRGCHFEGSANLTCDDSSIFCFPSHISPFRRCLFFQTSIQYNSGPRLMVDFTEFENEGAAAITIAQCDFFTSCNSFYSSFLGEAIVSNDVDKYDVFLNLFNGGQFQANTLNLVSGNYGDSPSSIQQEGSFIRDNIFNAGSTHINTHTDTDDLNIFCNQHFAYNNAWDIDGALKNQGTVTESAENIFDHTGFDIMSTKDFIYHHYTNEMGRPFSVSSPQVTLDEITTPPPPTNCADIGSLITDWRAYHECYNQLNRDDVDRKYLICCTCCSPPPPPSQNPYGIPIEGRSRKDNNISTSQSSSAFFIKGDIKDSNLQVMDASGRILYSELVQSYSASIDLLGWNTGIYFVHITRDNKSIHESKIFVH